MSLAKPVAALLALCLLACFSWATPPGSPHLARSGPLPGKDRELKRREARQTANLKHCRYVAKHGKGRTLASHRNCVRWVSRELRKTRRILYPPTPTIGYWIGRQIWAANLIGAASSGDPWPNCPDPFDGGGSWQDTVDCENGGNWYDSPGYYRCGLQFDPMWERKYGRLCP